MNGLAPRLQALVAEVRKAGLDTLRSSFSEELTPTQLEADIARSIYDRHHARWTRDPQFRVTTRDPALEERFVAATPHQFTTAVGEFVSMTGGYLRIALDGVLVRVPPGVPLEGVDEGSVTLRVPAIRPVLSPGFLLVDGSSGRPDGAAVVRFYIQSSSPSHAVHVWRTTLSSLEALSIRYRAKVASSAGMFPRADAMVVYCSAAAEGLVRGSLRASLRGLLEREVAPSVFTEGVASGLEFAEEPLENAGGELSFGQHRSRAFAQGIIEGSQAGWVGAERLAKEALARNGIDPLRPWRNLRRGA